MISELPYNWGMEQFDSYEEANEYITTHNLLRVCIAEVNIGFIIIRDDKSREYYTKCYDSGMELL